MQNTGYYIKQLDEQSKRLFSSLISIDYSDNKTFAVENFLIAKKAVLCWDKTTEAPVWGGQITLTNEFYDEITQNKIGARQWTFINRRPTQLITTITNVNDCKKWNIGLGGFFGGNLERFDYGLGIIVTTNNQASYQAQYCFSDKSVRLGYYYNLRK